MATAIKSKVVRNIDEYIARYPLDIRKNLAQLRATIRVTVPEAKETIKYGIPTFTLHGNLVSFAAFKYHIGLYPVPRNVEPFARALARYAGAKSTARFPHGEPLPLPLIKRILKFLAKRNKDKSQRLAIG